MWGDLLWMAVMGRVECNLNSTVLTKPYFLNYPSLWAVIFKIIKDADFPSTLKCFQSSMFLIFIDPENSKLNAI